MEEIIRQLGQTANGKYAKEAERELIEQEEGGNISINILKILESDKVSGDIKLIGSVYLKNMIKRRWEDEKGIKKIDSYEENLIKEGTLKLLGNCENNVERQLGEIIVIIAEREFPKRWSNLVERLVEKLTLEDMVRNSNILVIMHRMFKRWRTLFRTDELFLEIQMVLDQFFDIFLKCFVEMEVYVEENKGIRERLDICFENVLLLVKIYYDLNVQDIPESFEDHMGVFMKTLYQYIVGDYYVYYNDSETNCLIKTRSAIFELLTLYVTKYADVFDPYISEFISAVWHMFNNYVTMEPEHDMLFVNVLEFLIATIKIPKYLMIFSDQRYIEDIVLLVVLPNIYFSKYDEESIEENPILFAKIDLDGPTYKSRRCSAVSLLREMNEVSTDAITDLSMRHINDLFTYKMDDCKSIEAAIFLFSSLASKGHYTYHGLTSVNSRVDVQGFFNDHIAAILVNKEAHYVLKVASIKYIYIFRNQLNDDQLLKIFVCLVKILETELNPAVYTYASIVIERLLVMCNVTKDNIPLFNKYTSGPYIVELLTNLFNLIFSNKSNSRQFFENEFLMKCVMRVVEKSGEFLTSKMAVLEQLIKIARMVYLNPTNAFFLYYIFDSIGFLIKNDISEIDDYHKSLSPFLMEILSNDIPDLISCSFQILSFLLENCETSSPICNDYKPLIGLLMNPSAWEYKGNIPSLTRLIISMVIKDHSFFSHSKESLTSLLGVFQKLIASEGYYEFSFDLIEAIIINIPMSLINNYLSLISILILTRLKNLKTEKFTKRFSKFLLTLAIISSSEISSPNKSNLNADFVLEFIDLVQENLFQQIINTFVLPLSKNLLNLLDKKIFNIGVSQLLTSKLFVTKYKNLAGLLIDRLIENIKLYSVIGKSSSVYNNDQTQNSVDAFSGLNLHSNQIDFGSHFSKLISIQKKPFDPLSNIKNNNFILIKSIILTNINLLDHDILAQLSNDTKSDLKILELQ